MKIALFSNEFPPNIYGGAGVHIDFLSQELAKLGEVEVRCFGDQNENTSTMNVRGINSCLTKMEDKENQHIKMFHNLSRNVEMSQATPQADVIHCHTWYTHLAGVFTRELLQVPLILTTHSLETHRPWKVEQLGNGYFLSRWIEDKNKKKWLHFDIAGPSYREENWGYYSYGATGVAIRLILRFLEDIK